MEHELKTYESKNKQVVERRLTTLGEFCDKHSIEKPGGIMSTEGYEVHIKKGIAIVCYPVERYFFVCLSSFDKYYTEVQTV
jgi:hypothetical protein